MDARRSHTTVAVALATVALMAGCEQKPAVPTTTTPPAASSAGTSSQPSASELASLRSLVGGEDKSDAPALPGGHAPVPSPRAQREPRSAARADGAASNVKFEAPDDWKPQTPRSTMRKGQYILPRTEGDADDGELVIYYFGPGQGGDVTDNLVRWRGQFTKADGSPLPDDAAAEQQFEANGLKITLLDVSGRYAPGAMPGMTDTGPRDGFRMYAAVIETSGGPWFVKATGPSATMEHHREAVRRFLSSAKH